MFKRMDFLFAQLPENNFQMNDAQLILWQHNAVFECECDNLINRRIEARRLENSEHLRAYAIDAAIQQHGLQRSRRRTRDISENNNDILNVQVPPPPPARRLRFSILNHDIWQESIGEAIRERGLRLARPP